MKGTVLNFTLTLTFIILAMPLGVEAQQAQAARTALNLGLRLGISDSDAQILYFLASVVLTAALVGVTGLLRGSEPAHGLGDAQTKPVGGRTATDSIG